MLFDHEKLDVYRIALEFNKFEMPIINRPDIPRAIKDQLFRAAMSVPLNIAEGNGKWSPAADRRRYFQIARGSATECAAVLDVIVACEYLQEEDVLPGK